MRRRDEVLCATCGRAFTIGLLEMVRLKHPLWCSECITHADAELAQAHQRAEGVELVLREQET